MFQKDLMEFADACSPCDSVSGIRGTLFRFNSEAKPEDGHQNEKELVYENSSQFWQIDIFSTSFEGTCLECPIEIEMLRSKGIWVTWKSLLKGNITKSMVC